MLTILCYFMKYCNLTKSSTFPCNIFISATTFNHFIPKSDLNEISPNNAKTLSSEQVGRIDTLIDFMQVSAGDKTLDSQYLTYGLRSKSGELKVIRVSPPYRAWVSIKIYSHLFQALSQSRWTQNMVEYEMAWRNISQPFLWISQPPCLLAHNLFLLWHSLIFTNWEPVISQIYSLVVKASWFQDRFNLGTVFSSKTGVWQWNETLESICFININFRTGLPD